MFIHRNAGYDKREPEPGGLGAKPCWSWKLSSFWGVR